jgi:hypothetical protein
MEIYAPHQATIEMSMPASWLLNSLASSVQVGKHFGGNRDCGEMSAMTQHFFRHRSPYVGAKNELFGHRCRGIVTSACDRKSISGSVCDFAIRKK